MDKNILFGVFVTLLMLLCNYMANGFVASTSATHPIFRRDYVYIQETNAFIKLSNKKKSWFDAKAVCEAEGAKLLVMRNKREAELITPYVETLPEGGRLIWIGLQDLISEGEFQTIDGEPISDVYSNWDGGEPNNHAPGPENCVIMKSDGKMNDVECTWSFPFICKMDVPNIRQNIECDNFDPDYKLTTPDQCIKFHKNPKTWNEAFMICVAEQGHLAIINSAEEAQLYVKELAKYPPESIRANNVDKSLILIGFHDKFTENEFVTVNGKPLSESGYEDWSPGQPDNYQNIENCGSMFRDGKLNDVSCSSRAMFICEKNLDDVLDVSLNSRNQNS